MSRSANRMELAAATERDPRWASVAARSTAADGTFYYSVKTTGVYCRPSCPARLARPENVRFHATRRDAESAGFRPCKRCKPDQPSLIEQHAAEVTEACRLIETSQDAQQVLGMTPTDYRAGGANAEIRFAIGECSLGSILVAKSGPGVCAILLGDDPDVLARDLQDKFPKATLIGGDPEFERLVSTVVGFVEAPGLGLDLPLDVRGTAFQQRVWQALREIPAGATASYADIATRIGAPRSVRAVAQACAANHLAVAIPCHRVVRHDGGLSGYRWGVERKRALLQREAAS
ncbi:MAG: bifunctional transcriptional activator/DNA repair enzyme AdaA [Gemmatimonadales bacterium]